MSKRILYLFLFIVSSAFSQSNNELYLLESNNICITESQRQHIIKEINNNIRKISFKPNITDKQQSLFDWPLRANNALTFNNYYGISNFVDQDTSSALLDYNCSSRTYDGHKGTDIFTWPFPWYLYDNNFVEVIAAKDGIIINKHDGHDDDHCSWNMGGSWNAVYVLHDDGSVAWYGHLKKNSLTNKAIGQSVLQGEYLGIVASSGYSTGPHLHLEIHDSLQNIIDPFSGNCNFLNNSSWWNNQRNFREPNLNALLTHNAKPVHGCPMINEEPNMSNYFGIGDTIYFAAYYSDRENGDSAEYRIKDPNGNIWDSWNHVSSTTYNVSWYYWKKLLPVNGPFGTWRFQLDFNGQSYTHHFDYNAVSSVENINDNRKIVSIINVMGKESGKLYNTPLFYIYDNGEVEKKIILK